MPSTCIVEGHIFPTFASETLTALHYGARDFPER